MAARIVNIQTLQVVVEGDEKYTGECNSVQVIDNGTLVLLKCLPGQEDALYPMKFIHRDSWSCCTTVRIDTERVSFPEIIKPDFRSKH